MAENGTDANAVREPEDNSLELLERITAVVGGAHCRGCAINALYDALVGVVAGMCEAHRPAAVETIRAEIAQHVEAQAAREAVRRLH